MIKKHLLLVLAMVLVGVSCKKEDTISPKIQDQLTREQQALKSWYEQSNLQLPHALTRALQTDSLEIDWKQAVEYGGDDSLQIAAYTVPVLRNDELKENWILNIVEVGGVKIASWGRYLYRGDNTLGAADYYTEEGILKQTARYTQGKSTEDWWVDPCYDTPSFSLQNANDKTVEDICPGKKGSSGSWTIDLPEVTVTAPYPTASPIYNPSYGPDPLYGSYAYKNDFTMDLKETGGGGSSIPMPEMVKIDINTKIIIDKKPAINPKSYIDCFNDGKATKEYKITLFVDQPVAGKSDAFSISTGYIMTTGISIKTENATLDVGHTFVMFEKINQDGTSVRQVMGFYPSGYSVTSKGAIKDDSGHEYDVSYAINNVSKTNFDNALKTVTTDFQSSQYVLHKNHNNGAEYNCTDAAIKWCKLGGKYFANASSNFFDNAPGAFGEVLRKDLNSTKNGGFAPKGKGPCN